jgi:glutamate-1-semialdehyde 2,1-aminomutase
MCEKHACAVTVNKVESLFTLFFSDNRITDFASAQKSDMNRYAELFRVLLDHGIFIAPSGFEAWFISSAHQHEHMEATLAGIRAFLES